MKRKKVTQGSPSVAVAVTRRVHVTHINMHIDTAQSQSSILTHLENVFLGGGKLIYMYTIFPSSKCLDMHLWGQMLLLKKGLKRSKVF